jgi:hypothetical protein
MSVVPESIFYAFGLSLSTGSGSQDFGAKLQ